MTPITTGRLRLAVGFFQGLALYMLNNSIEPGGLLAGRGEVFAPLLLLAIFVPALVILNIGNMRPRAMTAWILVAAALVIGLTEYDVFRRGDLNRFGIVWGHLQVFPSFSLVTFLVIGFFIGQSLILAADMEQKRIASYPRYFDVAWKLVVQLNFAAIFALVFWLVLFTGAGLFNLIKVSFFSELIRHDWFWIPATTLSVAYAIHITDVRVNLVRGIRTLKLVLLSWLLPIMTFFAAGFLITLPFKGIALLWATHHASKLLLGAASWLILLINAAYQDGTAEHTPARVLRYAGTLGAALLAPLVLIAMYAVFLRVGHDGWTVNLIEVFSCLVITAGYAAGYLWAAVSPGDWLRRLEKTNIYTSFVILAVLFALFTPIADPARLAVADQMSRLKTGRVSAEKFDYMYLRNQGEHYGEAALIQLKTVSGPDAAVIKEKAEEALKPPSSTVPPARQLDSQDLAANITVYPATHALPESFLKQDWKVDPTQRWMMPQCLYNKKTKCNAFIIDATATAPQQIILSLDMPHADGVLFQATDSGWKRAGLLSGLFSCKGVHDAMKAGQFNMVPASGQELDVAGLKIQVKQDEKCP